MRELDPTSAPYEGGVGDADVISIFDGPSGLFNQCAAASGLYAMPPVDKVAVPPVDILNDYQFAMLVQAILRLRVGLVIAAPDCGAWCAASHFNNRHATARATVEARRVEQRKVMQRMNAFFAAVHSYGGHIMVEDPAASLFWKQDFVKKLESEASDDRTWRDIVINYCGVGGRYLKPICFRTTAPPTATAHMEGLLCDHEFNIRVVLDGMPRASHALSRPLHTHTT